MKQRILVVADDTSLRATLARWLMAAGYAIELAESGNRAREVAAAGDVALALVDPDGLHDDTADLIRDLAAEVGQVLRIAGSADETGNRNGSKANGAIAKPLREAEVLSRVAAAINVTSHPPQSQAEAGPEVLRFAGYTLYAARRSCHAADGTDVPLTAGEFSMLLALARAAGRVLSRDDLSNAAVGRPAERQDRSVDMLISRIRRKIETDPKAPRLIVTVPGAGYRFADGVEIDVSSPEMAAQAATQHPQLVRAPPPIAAASSARPAGSPKSFALWTSGSVAAVMLLGTAAVVWYAGFAARNNPAPAGSVRSFVAAAVPLVTDQVRSDLADYERAPDAKALALSGDGWGEAVGKSDVESAKREALLKCRDMEPTVSCKLYAVGNTVVWAASMLELPMAAEVHSDPLDVSLTQGDLIRALPSAPPRAFERYAEMPNPKTFAIGNTSWAASSHNNRSEALRLAIERCSYRDLAPCVLIAVDGKLTVRVPQARQIEGVFTLAGARGMAEADRLRIAKTYSGRDWRALSRGKTGWYAVADLPSESAAEDAALAACARADSECRLYAISNFRVAAEK